MRIYKMTATFGKLEQETLALEPGLNLIEAPNEWGKTTWCAFLITMLYGLDTRAKTTKTALADKERYTPWSGSPMAGRIDLCWNGRDITIERSTRGRVPMGQFRAYETESGMAVPELTASNCGILLLGVEQSVYRRSGFIRQSDMPVTQDDALRRRLNALVTTGDETGDSDRLEEELKSLKNKCRYHRSGLLPQAEAQQKELEEKIGELESLQIQSRKLKERQAEMKDWLRSLENHWQALQYAAAEEDALRVAEARDLRDKAEEKMLELEKLCAGQPVREDVEDRISAIGALQEEWERFRAAEAEALQPKHPVSPEMFRGMAVEQAEAMVESDARRYGQLTRKNPQILLFLPGALCLVLGALMLGMREWSGAVLLAVATVFFALGMLMQMTRRQERRFLEKKYGSGATNRWWTMFQNYKRDHLTYARTLQDYQSVRSELELQRQGLQQRKEGLCGMHAPERVLEIWLKMRRQWEHYEIACREYQQAEKYLQTMQTMAGPAAKKPAMEDLLTYSEEETQTLLAQAQTEQQHLQNRLGQYQGRMDALGEVDVLQDQLQVVQMRIGKLENIYEAAVLALETLTHAKQDLQRRFSPRISKRAREMLAQMTGGRYDRLLLSQDLSLMAGAEKEEILRDVLWRSDGTVDQLYLALRLAVAGELMPEAPLVLDDALVRFDDNRLEAVMEILKQEAQNKQIILFSCQHREAKLLP